MFVIEKESQRGGVPKVRWVDGSEMPEMGLKWYSVAIIKNENEKAR